ncbi:MAG TPA: hypothetical protein VFX70_23150, partial [Mycobacteriales bacterium]|nr:hypothetical protein [Mycobacteriales bacterium]
GNALLADRATITGSLVCGAGFTVRGRLSFLHAHIGKDLDLDDAVLHGDGVYALNLERATVGTKLRLRCKSIDGGIVDVTGTDIGHLDDKPSCWPDKSLLAGLTYRSICDRGDDFTKARRAWVRRHLTGYAPQVYDQLASTYRAAGHAGGARKVLIAKQSARRSQPLPDRSRLHRLLRHARRAVRAGWSWFLRWTIGYGYAPWRSLWWLAPLYLAGWLEIFRRIRPQDLTALHRGEVFHPALYTLDLLVPVVSLKQRDAWAVHGGYEWWTAGYTAIGWLAASIIAAGLAGVFKRD